MHSLEILTKTKDQYFAKNTFFQNFVSMYEIFKWRFTRIAVTNNKNITKKYCFKLQVSDACIFCSYSRI